MAYAMFSWRTSSYKAILIGSKSITERGRKKDPMRKPEVSIKGMLHGFIRQLKCL